MSYSFSSTSRRRLYTCDTRLIAVCEEAIKLFDFTVVCGYRSNEEQARLLEQGMTRVGPGESLHNRTPSAAVDLAPYPIDWYDFERFRFLGGLMTGLGHTMGVDLRWGGDWNSNGVFTDQTFMDLPHFELRGA